ncbi:hypothetical protein SAMN05444266_104271 [Chitinophaga jiangningensis]|uniref:Uncharacterized protein n=1 Tax=Chitinophaga jiangningensis TaxID=1419482 RepID=A0A1M7CBU8_9BACT|nr:hypothetical protein [Chitinophaga jiangningensis]SHL64742.1 hypothetical protein SAMN05444266_104271 [Chitinophaga jiangningensis]
MSEFLKKTLYFTLIPIGIVLLLLLTGGASGLEIGISLLLLLLFGYFLGGLILLLIGRREIGKVLLLSCGIILLVGLSTCGILLMGM